MFGQNVWAHCWIASTMKRQFIVRALGLYERNTLCRSVIEHAEFAKHGVTESVMVCLLVGEHWQT